MCLSIMRRADISLLSLSFWYKSSIVWEHREALPRALAMDLAVLAPQQLAFITALMSATENLAKASICLYSKLVTFSVPLVLFNNLIILSDDYYASFCMPVGSIFHGCSTKKNTIFKYMFLSFHKMTPSHLLNSTVKDGRVVYPGRHSQWVGTHLSCVCSLPTGCIMSLVLWIEYFGCEYK